MERKGGLHREQRRTAKNEVSLIAVRSENALTVMRELTVRIPCEREKG